MSVWTNPIYERELLGRLRSWKTVAAILAVALVTCGLVLLRWPSDATVDRVSQGAVLVFRPLAFAMALAVMMLVPAFPATSLVTERQRGTLALLLASPTSPLQLYLGKLLSNVLLSLLLISVSLPALAACYAMGGVTWADHILPLLLVLTAMAVQYSAIGLWISARVGSADAALRLTYATVLTLTVLSFGPLVIVGNLSGILATVARWLTMVSPLSALQEITGAQAAASAVGVGTGWKEFLGATAAITLGLAWATIRQLDPLLLDRARPTGLVVGRGAAKAGFFRRVAYIVDPNKRKPGIPRWINPIMVKEFRTRRFGRLHWLIRLVAACAIVSLLLTVVAATGTVSWGVERIAGPLVLMQVALLLLVGPSLGANLIAGEVESGGWEILRATPISARKVLVGKIMSVLWTMLLVLLATLPGYAVMSYIQPSTSGQVGNVILSLLVAVCMVVSISACVSGFIKSTAAATATAYGVLLTLFAGTLVVWLARGRPFGPVFVERVLMLNPAAAALSEMNTPGFEQYNLTPMAWWIGLGISAACLGVLAVRIWRLTKPD
ncbi:MAG: ABC transporter permease [Planctomycetota bacterium]|nr:MAG: ABC transporter permease [Planctomycetota bacterium]